MRDYGYGGQSPSQFELDHLISLEIGGSPRLLSNLWPEWPHSPNKKDAVENRLRAAVCTGAITLADAQNGIAADWMALGHELGVIGL
jgi:hypothetical protein